VLRRSPKISLIYISSADVYGSGHKKPISEDVLLNPTNPYSASKAAAEMLVLGYTKTYKLKTLILRPFNHTGPGQSQDFVVPAIARQIVLIKRRKQRTLKLGDTSPVRDFTDVRDIVQAYITCMEKFNDIKGDIYNVCSGRGLKVRQIIDILLGVDGLHVPMKVEEKRLRPVDVPYLVGNPRKFKRATGWKPKIPIERTLFHTLLWWKRTL
jgi:GDP-4-dehydro-6-deoxy-D-mannose reductase